MNRPLSTLIVLALLQPLWLAAEITAPKTVSAGGILEITWSDEVPKGGRFQVVTSKGEPLKGGAYGYQHKAGQSISIAAPLKPGTYGVVLAQGGEFKGLKTFEVTAVTATLAVPKTVEMNAQFKVAWKGPAYSSDIVAIADVGGNSRTGSYTYPKLGKDGTVTLTAPVKPGAYEVIYQMKTEILAREAFTVGGTEASLQIPKTVQAGGDLEILWQGPNNQGDIISVVSPGATKRGTIYTFSGISTGNRVMLTVGETLGAYEVIYLTGSEVLARAPFNVIEVSATLEAPSEVVATLAFETSWSGPANRKDSIVMMPKGIEPKRPYASLSYVVKDEPVATMIAPKEPGDYTLHYLTREGKELAARPIKVTPAQSDPGFLNVVSDSSKGFGENTAVELILDASGSMLKRQGKKRRIEIAKETILGLLNDVIPNGTGFAMRVFGHKEADSCRTDLEIPLGPLDSSAAKLKVAGINAMNLAKTPIAASLTKVSSDLNGGTGERLSS